MTATDTIFSFALLFTAAGAWCDLRTGQIPNRLTFGALALGGALSLWALCWAERPEGHALTLSFVAIVLARVAFATIVCALVPYLLFLRNGMGGGDVKLLAGLGATLGPVIGLEVELYAFVVMALFALGRLAYSGRLTRTISNSAALLLNPFLPQQRRRDVSPELLSSFKFGPAVFAATALVCLLRWRSA